MLIQLVKKSLLKDIPVNVWTAAVLTILAALAAVFFHMSAHVGAKMSDTLRQIGANAVAYNAPSANKPQAEIWRKLTEICQSRGFDLLISRVQVGLAKGSPAAVVMSDAQLLKKMTPYWRITGRRAITAGECIIGKRAADRFSVEPGQTLEFKWPMGKTDKLLVTGIIYSGDEDEDKIFQWHPDQDAIGMHGSDTSDFTYGLLSIKSGLNGILEINHALQSQGSSIVIKPVRQILHGEGIILEKINLLAGLSLLVVLLMTTLGMAAALTARVMERRRELALMRAIGATPEFLAVFLLLGAVTIGVFAAAAGYCVGAFFSQFILWKIFHAGIEFWNFLSMAATAAMVLFVTLVTEILAVNRALHLQPALVLRGE